MRPISLAGTKHAHAVASTDAMLVLLDVTPDPVGHPFEVLHLALNNQDVTYKGTTYLAFSFDLEPIYERDTGELQQIRLTVCNVNRMIEGYLQLYGGGVGASVTLWVVTMSDITGDPLMQLPFMVVATESNAQLVTFTLGAASPLHMLFPKYLYLKDHCIWQYKGYQCGYAGGLATCDKTLSGTNGCVAHANAPRYGAFPGIETTGVFTASAI